MYSLLVAAKLKQRNLGTHEKIALKNKQHKIANLHIFESIKMKYKMKSDF